MRFDLEGGGGGVLEIGLLGAQISSLTSRDGVTVSVSLPICHAEEDLWQPLDLVMVH